MSAINDTPEARYRARVAGWAALRFSGTGKLLRAAWRTLHDPKHPAPKLAAPSMDSRQQKRHRALAEAFQQVSHPDVAGGEPRKNRRRMALSMMHRTWRAQA